MFLSTITSIVDIGDTCEGSMLLSAILPERRKRRRSLSLGAVSTVELSPQIRYDSQSPSVNRIFQLAVVRAGWL
jgi:hypothetical protein